MAEISKITDITGTTYDIKDVTARSAADGKVSKAGDTTFSGRTITNHLVNFTIPEELGIDIGPDYLEGKLCEVRIEHARPYSVDGVLVSLKGE